jgi:integrase
MNVKLKSKKLQSGRISIYLSYYNPNTQKRKKEYLGLYLFDKPKDVLERDHNKQTNRLAIKVHSKRLLEYQSDRFGFKTKEKTEITFLAYFESIADKKKQTSSKSNYSNWISSLKHLRKFTRRSLKLSEIDHNYLNDLKDYLIHQKIARSNKKLSQNSALSYFAKVICALKEAYNEGLVLDNPAKGIKGISPTETKREFLLEAEIQNLFNTECQNPIIKNAFLFGVLTGLRFSDIQTLFWEDLYHSETNGWFIRFRQNKTKATETLYINNQARSLLGEKGSDSDSIFKELKYSAHNNYILRDWIRLAGINRHITFHSSRHTHACLLLAKGVDIYTVSKMLGHKDLKTTQIYAKVIDQNKINAVKNIPEFL